MPDAADRDLGGVVAYGYIDGNNIVDTSTSQIVANIPVRSRDSDSSGYWYLDLRWSSKLVGGTDGTYDINGYYGDKLIFNVDDLTVPDLESFNLADTMEAR